MVRAVCLLHRQRRPTCAINKIARRQSTAVVLCTFQRHETTQIHFDWIRSAWRGTYATDWCDWTNSKTNKRQDSNNLWVHSLLTHTHKRARIDRMFFCWLAFDRQNKSLCSVFKQELSSWASSVTMTNCQRENTWRSLWLSVCKRRCGRRPPGYTVNYDCIHVCKTINTEHTALVFSRFIIHSIHEWNEIERSAVRGSHFPRFSTLAERTNELSRWHRNPNGFFEKYLFCSAKRTD